MILLCPISSTQVAIPEFAGITAHWQHPIFSLTRAELLTIFSNQYLKNRLEDSEKRLLCLAMLTATELVTWEAAALGNSPTPAILNQSMPAMASILEFSLTCPGWPNSQLSEFPIFRIAEGNCDLGNLKEICATWLACISDYHAGYAAAKLRAEEVKKLNFLEHMRAGSHRRPRRYLKALSRYVVSAIPTIAFYPHASIGLSANHAMYIIEYCGIKKELETAPERAISKVQIEALQDLILDHLSLDNTYVWQASKAIEQLLTERGYDKYESPTFTMSDEKFELITTAIQDELGSRPLSFIAAMSYDARAIAIKNRILEEMK